MFVLLLQDKICGDAYFDKRSIISCNSIGWWANDDYLFSTKEEALEYAEQLLLSTDWFRKDIKLEDFKAIKLIRLNFDEFGFEYCTKEYLDYHPNFKARVNKDD